MARLARDGANLPNALRLRAPLFAGSPDLYLAHLDTVVRSVFRYRGENEEVIRTPARMWLDLETLGYVEGDCDDVAVFFASILKACGFQVRFVAIRYDDTPDFKHVFVEAFDGQEWRRLDPTVAVGTVHRETERMQVYV